MKYANWPPSEPPIVDAGLSACARQEVYASSVDPGPAGHALAFCSQPVSRSQTAHFTPTYGGLSLHPKFVGPFEGHYHNSV